MIKLNINYCTTGILNGTMAELISAHNGGQQKFSIETLSAILLSEKVKHAPLLGMKIKYEEPRMLHVYETGNEVLTYTISEHEVYTLADTIGKGFDEQIADEDAILETPVVNNFGDAFKAMGDIFNPKNNN